MMGKTCSGIWFLACLCVAAMFRPVFLQAYSPASNVTSTRQKRGEHNECCRDCRSSIDAMRTNLHSVSSAVETNARETKNAQDKILSLEIAVATKFSSLENRLNAFILKGSAEAVGFQARLSASVDIRSSGSLVLDRAEYNSGGGYDPKTGVFTVPVTGLYLFLLNMASDYTGYSAWIVIVLDNTELCKTWSRYSTEIEMASCQATTRAVKGQRVWLRSDYNSRVRGGLWTTFTGVLIQREY